MMVCRVDTKCVCSIGPKTFKESDNYHSAYIA